MPNTLVPAAGEAVPANITRRAALRGIASIPAIGGATAALTLETSPVSAAPADTDAGLFALVPEYEAADAELKQAKDDLEWLAAEWKHQWPLAPEEILNFPHGRYSDSCERDIAGTPIERDAATVSLPRWRWYVGQEKVAIFTVKTAAELAGERDYWRRQKPSRAKLPARIEKARLFQAARDAEMTKAHGLALQYEAETARLREASGVGKVRKRIAEKHRAFNAVEARLMQTPAKTIAGVTLKAKIFITSQNSSFMGKYAEIPDDGSSLALSGGWIVAEELAGLGGVS